MNPPWVDNSVGNSRILLIDDDDCFRQIVRKFLRARGFEVFEAPDGKAGMLLAAQHPPDLVVCDLLMPEMDGYQVLSALEQDPRFSSIPFLFLTGESAPHKVREGMNRGADDYLTKPVLPEDLLAAIQARLKKARQRSVEKPMPEPGAFHSDSPPAGVFLLRTGGGRRLVKVEGIACIFAYGEYSRVCLGSEAQAALVRKSLKQWLVELPNEKFIRVRRNVIINLDFLTGTRRTADGRVELCLRNFSEPIVASLRMAADLNRKLKRFRR